MDITKDIERLISRYLNGTISPEDELRMLKWINDSEKNKLHLHKLKDIWDASLKKEDISLLRLAEFYRIQANRSSIVAKKTVLWKWISGIAAVLIIGLILNIYYNTPEFDNRIITNHVPLGSKSQVTLPDGTKVNLNSGSTLKYPSAFRKRTVTLSGEAFFDVVSDKINPFIVSTSDFDITVTGTQFNVCTYNDNNFSSVSLFEGKILLGSSKFKSLALNPGEKMELDRVNKKIMLAKADCDTETGWKDGKFVFNRIAFPYLIKRLERWYDVKINYNKEEFRNLQYTGTFKNQETIWQVFDALQLTSPINYERISFREFKLIYKPM